MEGQESSGDEESSEPEETQQPEEEQEPVAPVTDEDDKTAKSDDQPPEDSAEAGESESDSPGQTDEVVEDEPVPDKQDEDKTDTSEDEEKKEEPAQPEPEAEPVEDVQAAEETGDKAEKGDGEEAAPADAEPKAEPAAEPEPDEEEPQFDKGIFAIKTSIGHEKMVADTLEGRIRRRKADVYSIMLPPNLRGYLLIEALDNREALRDLIKGVQHARTIVEGTTTIEEIEGFLTPKPIVAGIEEGDIVEVIAGPFKGEKAKVKQIDISKEEITIELFEAMVSIPVTIRGDHVRVLEKESS